MSDIPPHSGASRVELGSEPEFALGRMKVRPAELFVEQEGERRELQPRVMQVLVVLAKARPAVVPRDSLVEQCWDGRIVGDDALNRCILALRHLAQEWAPPPFVIETVPRVGHRIVASDGVMPQTARFRRLAFVAAAALMIVAAIVLFWQQRGTAPEPASIAVLPFRNLGTGDPYFAEGLAEEILGQLAREPHFRVAGRTSSSQFKNATDLREVGRRLDVDYVLEGSVRARVGRVRINAALVETKSGVRLWSDNYDGNPDDILSMQQQVATAVAAALGKRLLRPPAMSGPLVTSGEAYRNYLTARGLLMTRNPQLASTAVELLNQAVAINPNYAPAWASLADAIRLRVSLEGHERVIATLPKARAYARRAVALAPELAQAHGVLGALLGYTSSESQWHLRRAAELDPTSADAQLWLGSARRIAGDFEGEMAAYRRAQQLDRLWHRPTRDLVVAIAEMGDRARAEAIIPREYPEDFVSQNMLAARIAWIFGDISEATQRWSAVMRVDSISRPVAQIGLSNARFTLGLSSDGPNGYAPVAELRSNVGRAWIASAPSPGVWRQRNRSEMASLVYHELNFVGAKLMLNAGRTDELSATYDSPSGLLGILKSKPLQPYQFGRIALVALVLNEEGRSAEARQLLAQADRLLESVYRSGKVPFTFDADAAAVYAVQGRTSDAIVAIERAVKRGWPHLAPDDLRRLDDEPVYKSIRREPRFRAIVAKLENLYSRERKETQKLGL